VCARGGEQAELVEETSWSADRYETWLAALLAGQLLGAPFEA
jgi:hypothetical protein